MPRRLLNLIYGLCVTRALDARPASWPLPAFRPVEGIPIVSSELLPAVRRGDVVADHACIELSRGLKNALR
jgi:hypothetical protein